MCVCLGVADGVRMPLRLPAPGRVIMGPGGQMIQASLPIQGPRMVAPPPPYPGLPPPYPGPGAAALAQVTHNFAELCEYLFLSTI